METKNMKYSDLRFPKAWYNRMMSMRNGVKISWRNFWYLRESGIDMFIYMED